MKLLAFLLVLSTLPVRQVVSASPMHLATADSVPSGKAKRMIQSPYQQAPPPIIMPGTHLDTNFRSLAKQDPAVRRVAPAWLRARTKGEPTFILDGKVATINQIKRLKQTDVASITTLDGDKAAVLYGPNARQGLLLITTKGGL